MTRWPTYTFDIRKHDDGELWSDAFGDDLRGDLTAEQIDLAIVDAVQACINGDEDMALGIDTPVYWTGLLFSFPWGQDDYKGDVPDDETYARTLLEGAKVHDGGLLDFTHRGTPWADKLRRFAKAVAAEEDKPVDLTFGGNLEAECHVIARNVMRVAIANLARRYPQPDPEALVDDEDDDRQEHEAAYSLRDALAAVDAYGFFNADQRAVDLVRRAAVALLDAYDELRLGESDNHTSAADDAAALYHVLCTAGLTVP